MGIWAEKVENTSEKTHQKRDGHKKKNDSISHTTLLYEKEGWGRRGSQIILILECILKDLNGVWDLLEWMSRWQVHFYILLVYYFYILLLVAELTRLTSITPKKHSNPKITAKNHDKNRICEEPYFQKWKNHHHHHHHHQYNNYYYYSRIYSHSFIIF